MTDITLQFAQKAFVVSDNRLLLVRKSSSDPFNPGRWDIPGGRLKPGEDADLESHLAREVWEEVGLRVVPGAPFHCWTWTMAIGPARTAQVVAIARLCTASFGTFDYGNRDIDDHLEEACWVPLASVRDLDFIPSLRPAVENFLEMTSGRPSHAS